MSADGEPPSGNRQVSCIFEPEPSGVAAARRFVTGALAGWGMADPEISLLVSELATNAVLHARSDFEVTVRLKAEAVRVEVFDRNTRLPALAVVPVDAYSGRGLLLVQRLAKAWGVESRSNEGKMIWFELSRTDRAGS